MNAIKNVMKFVLGGLITILLTTIGGAVTGIIYWFAFPPPAPGPPIPNIGFLVYGYFGGKIGAVAGGVLWVLHSLLQKKPHRDHAAGDIDQ